MIVNDEVVSYDSDDGDVYFFEFFTISSIVRGQGGASQHATAGGVADSGEDRRE